MPKYTEANQDALFPELINGIEEFNKKQFFDCHETLEALWNKQSGLPRLLTQAIIQIAVGYYHLQKGNFLGSQKLLKKGLSKLETVRETDTLCGEYKKIDINDLIVRVGLDLKKVINHHVVDQFPVIRFLP